MNHSTLRFGKITAFAFAAAGMLAWVSPSHAYRMIQVSGSGRYTSSNPVTCDDVNGFVHWWTTNISFRGAGVDAARQAAIQTALNSWTNVAGASHVLSFSGSVSNPYPVNNADGFNSFAFVHDPTSPCTGSCLAITALSILSETPGHEIQEADIVFNMNQPWSTNGSNYDVQAVATHEIGHALGLHHSEVSGATMYQGYTTNWRSLESDDIQALQCSEDWYVSPSYQGLHETTTCRGITGWAKNTKRPNGYAWVAAWNGNLSWNDAPADDYRADVGSHSYTIPPPGYYRDGNYRTITVKFPNGATSPGSPQSLICQVGIFRNETPALFLDTGGLDYSVGNEFSSSIPGYVTHLRYYKATEEAGVHSLSLWNTSGQRLGSVDVDFGAAGVAGWKTGKLAGNGIQIQANTHYVVTVTTSTKQSKTNCGSFPLTNGPITGHGGRWVQGNNIYPTTGSCSNFWADVYFDQ
ncbi:MAG: hypothetical protein QOH06_1599 [Acidobacteriota bacterium]|jgi:hypothetical protein|nr:hypothetical protein [Acidobacteriota bacterium]